MDTSRASPRSTTPGTGDYIEAWVSQRHGGITCSVIRDDETEYEYVGIDAVSRSGAQQRFAAELVELGYESLGDWETQWEDERTGEGEDLRYFRVVGTTAGVLVGVSA